MKHTFSGAKSAAVAAGGFGTAPPDNGPLQNTWHGLTQMPRIRPGGASLAPCQLCEP